MGACTFANRVEQSTVDGKRAVEIDLTMSASYATGGDTVALGTVGLNVVDRIEVIGAPATDSGKASSATATTLVDSSKTWTVNAYSNMLVRIIAGTGAGQLRKITSNTATALTVPTWTVTPDATSLYRIEATSGREVRFDTSSPTAPLVLAWSAANTEVTAATNVSSTALRVRFIGS